MPRGIVTKEKVEIFRKVEYNDDHHQKRDGEEESPDELLEYICIYSLHLQSCSDFHEHHVAPFGEIASDDVLAGFAHQPKVETDVV